MAFALVSPQAGILVVSLAWGCFGAGVWVGCEAVLCPTYAEFALPSPLTLVVLSQ